MNSAQKLSATEFFNSIQVGELIQLYLPTEKYRSVTVCASDEILTRIQTTGLSYESKALVSIINDAIDRIKETWKRNPETGDRVALVKMRDGSIRSVR
jgi:hypothetical protein